MKEVQFGFTDYSVLVFIPDPASTDGSGKTGLVAANLTASYSRVETDNDVTVTDVTSSLNNLAALTTAHTDWGWLEVSNTLAPGLYRFDIADAVFASGAWQAVVYVMITTSAAAASPMEFTLVPAMPIEGVMLANGVAHGGALGGSTATFAMSRMSVVSQSNNTTAFTITGNGTGAGAIIGSGSGAFGTGLSVVSNATNGSGINIGAAGTGSGITITSGGGSTSNGITVTCAGTDGHGVEFRGIGTGHGMLLTGGANGNGLSAEGGTNGNGAVFTVGASGLYGLSVTGNTQFQNDFVVVGEFVMNALSVDTTTTFSGAITGTNGGNDLRINGLVPGAAGGLFIAGTNAATTITTSLTTTFTGNLTGSVGSVVGAVGSVTGAVGSVTGNVGGNVTGSVGSVVGAVGSVTGNVGGNVTGSVGSVVGAVGSVTGNVGGNVVGSVASVVGAVGSVTGNVGGNLVGTVGGMTATSLAQFFTLNSGSTYGASVAGSVVKEIVDNAGGGTGLTAQQTRDAMKLAPTAGAPAADSIDGKLDALSASAGTGAFTITVTVTDGTDPLQNARVRVIEGVNNFISDPTDVNGEAEFALDAATYAVAVTKDGYQFTPTTRTVTGEEAGTLTDDLEMVIVAPNPPPAEPGMCVIYGYIRDMATQAFLPGIEVRATLTPDQASKSGGVLVGRSRNALTNEAGYFSISVPKSNTITPASSQWIIECDDCNFTTTQTLNADTYDIGTAIV